MQVPHPLLPFDIWECIIEHLDNGFGSKHAFLNLSTTNHFFHHLVLPRLFSSVSFSGRKAAKTLELTDALARTPGARNWVTRAELKYVSGNGRAGVSFSDMVSEAFCQLHRLRFIRLKHAYLSDAILDHIFAIPRPFHLELTKMLSNGTTSCIKNRRPHDTRMNLATLTLGYCANSAQLLQLLTGSQTLTEMYVCSGGLSAGFRAALRDLPTSPSLPASKILDRPLQKLTLEMSGQDASLIHYVLQRFPNLRYLIIKGHCASSHQSTFAEPIVPILEHLVGPYKIVRHLMKNKPNLRRIGVRTDPTLFTSPDVFETPVRGLGSVKALIIGPLNWRNDLVQRIVAIFPALESLDIQTTETADQVCLRPTYQASPTKHIIFSSGLPRPSGRICGSFLT